jgi:hypothetical protein
MKDESAKNLGRSDTVVFKSGMIYSGSAELIAKPAYENVEDGGSGFYFSVKLPDGTVLKNQSCSMFEEPNLEKTQV